MVPSLPDDVLYLISIELWHQKDFDSLFNMALSSKILAGPALSNLYRMHDVAPVTNGGSDDHRSGDIEAFVMALEKWSKLWRAMIMSSLGKTAYPYCRYIRVLNLTDFKYLLEEPLFNSNCSAGFFSDALAPFKKELDVPGNTRAKRARTNRLDWQTILISVGEVLTKQTPMLEDLSAEIPPTSLEEWIPRLGNLRRLSLWNGAALVHAGSLLHAHCPHFKVLKIYQWSGEDADALFAAFLSDLRPQSLESLEIFSYSDISTETFLALANHSSSLKELILTIKPEAMPHISFLKSCTALSTLHLSETSAYTYLERSQNEVFLEVISWLKECKQLQDISFVKMLSAPAILEPVLLENDIHLEKLEVLDYPSAQAKAFHQALAHQTSLQSLHLRADAEGCDNDVLVTSLCKLTKLTYLRLTNVSDYFKDEHICRLAMELDKLEDFWVSGWAITDGVLPSLSTLTCLRKFDLNALSSFTLEGLLEYVSNLQPSNNGLVFSVMMADPETALTEEEQMIVRSEFAAKLEESRFDYMLSRDPNAPEYDSSDSD